MNYIDSNGDKPLTAALWADGTLCWCRILSIPLSCKFSLAVVAEQFSRDPIVKMKHWTAWSSPPLMMQYDLSGVEYDMWRQLTPDWWTPDNNCIGLSSGISHDWVLEGISEFEPSLPSCTAFWVLSTPEVSDEFAAAYGVLRLLPSGGGISPSLFFKEWFASDLHRRRPPWLPLPVLGRFWQSILMCGCVSDISCIKPWTVSVRFQKVMLPSVDPLTIRYLSPASSENQSDNFIKIKTMSQQEKRKENWPL